MGEVHIFIKDIREVVFSSRRKSYPQGVGFLDPRLRGDDEGEGAV